VVDPLKVCVTRSALMAAVEEIVAGPEFTPDVEEAARTITNSFVTAPVQAAMAQRRRPDGSPVE
jgi:hypothetical protein